MKAVNTLLALLVSLAIAFGVFEAGLRVIGLGPPKVLNQFDADLGWSKQPGRSLHRRTAEYDVTFELNDLGLRDDADLTVAKPADTYRVIALGDSFTLGYTVEREDLFVDQLEARWNAEGRKVQVVNAGTEGYATDQEVAWLETHGKDWQPDLVLLFSYDNDIFYNGETHYLRFPKPRYDVDGTLEQRTLEDPGQRSFLHRTAIGNLVLPKERLKTFTPAAGNGATLSEFAPLFNERPDFIADAENRTRGALAGLARVAKELECDVVVVPIPSHSSIDAGYAETFTEMFLPGAERGDWDADRPVQLVLDAARAAGLPVLDPRTALREASASDDLYFEKDFHLNPAGNRVFSDFLLAHLDAVAPSLPTRTQDASADAVVQSAGSGGLPGFLPWYLGLWLIVGCMYATYYKADEQPVLAFLKVGALLAVIFTIAVGGTTLIGMLPPDVSKLALLLVILVILGFVAYKLGDRLSTIVELIAAFVARGHWYLMPMVVVLLTVGSLLVVAASSPLVAPFIYTLF